MNKHFDTNYIYYILLLYNPSKIYHCFFFELLSTLTMSYTELYNVQDRIESHMDRNGFKLVGLIIINKMINAV